MSLGSAFGGLFGGGPKAPTFDAAAATAAQTAANAGAMKANSLNRGGPFGSSTFAMDASGNPTGINNSLDSSLNAGAFSGNLGLLGGQLPGTTIDFSNTTPEQIANQNYGAYSAMTAPQRKQQTDALNVDLTNRGLPVGGEASNNAHTNQNMAFNVADTNAAAQAWNAVPGMQATMTNTAIQQGQSPYQLAGLNMGLLQGLNGLAPQAQQYQTGAVDAAGNLKTAYSGEMDAYKANKASDSALLNTIGTGAGMFLGGGGGAGLLNYGKNIAGGGGPFNNASYGTPAGYPYSGVR